MAVLNPSPEERIINWFILKSPDAGPDLRLGRVGGPGEELSFGGEQVHGLAQGDILIFVLDRTRKDPWVAAEETFFPPSFESERRSLMPPAGSA